MGAPKKGARSLAQFARAKRREGCPVCELDKAVREQLAEASRKKINRTTQRDWLRVEHDCKVTDAQLNAHYSSRHDAEE